MADTKMRRKKSKRNIITTILIIILLFILVPIIVGASIFGYYIKDTPKLDYAKLEDTVSSKIYDKNNNLLFEIGEEKREAITPTEIPAQLKDAVLSVEDQRFEKHIGVDPVRIAGAALSNLKGNHTQGGSTLTQQLIKLSYFTTKKEDQTYKRKAQEAWLALKLEKTKSKDEILTYYINRVYMANGLYGMKTAADVYYNKPFDKLTLPEYALLAGIPQAPNNYDPYTNKEAAKQRRDLVLKQMLENQKINDQQYKEAVDTPIDAGLQPMKEDSSSRVIADPYINQVVEEVEKKTKKNVNTDGLDIYTNIDMEAQTYLYNLVNSDETSINFPDDQFQTSATLIDVKTGYVRAEIGGRKNGQDMYKLNRAANPKSNRDIGSTSKPLVAYGPLIENESKGTGTIFVDEPYRYKTNHQSVYNYDKSYRGAISMREALVDSRNIPALKALNEVGTDKAKEFTDKLGLNTDIYEGSAISIQSQSEKLAAAYAPFANGGIYYQPSYINKIVYQDGTEENFDPKGERAMKESTAFLITDILKDVIKRGTGTPAQIPNIIQAGKTGTSNYADDALSKVKDGGIGSPDISFVGYTPKYSLAVWTGYDDYFKPIPYQDQKLAMDIYRNFMTYLYQGIAPTDWKQPNDVVKVGNEYYIKGHLNSAAPVQSTYNRYSQDNNYYYDETPEENVVPDHQQGARTPASRQPNNSQQPLVSSSPREEPKESTPAPADSKEPVEQPDNQERE
ncbi:PBP1A family penicillin-binding protein [Vagococcus vulneris]|uniref:Uncharacterized protein n=1 Tax=Vagococcus vulneris TaxID=1977869 RepID=A0A429ZWN1_9ENTE|nr:PBP1A family penicillin-binding protein [Vagococcus vulneris]RST98219.1 hypothetical protein CBF37_08600 [Vagococcus vulneris]